jgi:hypothetical protein
VPIFVGIVTVLVTVLTAGIRKLVKMSD